MPHQPREDLRVVVVGDKETGKSSLILTACNKHFPPHPFRNLVRNPKSLSADFSEYNIPVTIFDTKPSVELETQLEVADVVILTYDCARPDTFDRLGTFWLPELQKLLPSMVPVIILGCKKDKMNAVQKLTSEDISDRFTELMDEFPLLIKKSLECSAREKPHEVLDIFSCALEAVIHPTIPPLYDSKNEELSFQTISALNCVFTTIYDCDKDGVFNDEERAVASVEQDDINSVYLGAPTAVS